MPFVTGAASSISDVLTALRNACTSNGWTLSGNVLHKDGCYVSHVISSSRIEQTGGTGIDGSNNLTGAGIRANAIGNNCVGGANGNPTYPANYYIFIHTDPDEVYLFLEYNTSYYHWLAFGQSPVSGLPGTGNWYAATARNGAADWTGISLTSKDGGRSNDWEGEGSLFTRTQGGPGNSFFHHNVDGAGWNQPNGIYQAITPMSPLYSVNGNLWNNEVCLIPINVYHPRPSSLNSLIGEIKHARFVRIPNYEPKDIIVLGSDQWFVLPWYSKNTNAPDGGIGVTHSGTLGVAIRYDGT